ncbi:MAG: hypothetical protein HY869_08605 [Chloroflexi bacterium]|nr:hypothetical protein [Chloroflexota bacterium]
MSTTNGCCLPAAGHLLNYLCLGGGEMGTMQAVWQSRFMGLDFENSRSTFIAATIVDKTSSSNSVCSRSASTTSNQDTPITLDMGSIASLPKQRQKARIAKVTRKQSSLTIFCGHQNFQNKKDHHQYMAMVLRFLSDSREISFRLDDCPPEKIGRYSPSE